MPGLHGASAIMLQDKKGTVHQTLLKLLFILQEEIKFGMRPKIGSPETGKCGSRKWRNVWGGGGIITPMHCLEAFPKH